MSSSFTIVRPCRFGSRRAPSTSKTHPLSPGIFSLACLGCELSGWSGHILYVMCMGGPISPGALDAAITITIIIVQGRETSGVVCFVFTEDFNFYTNSLKLGTGSAEAIGKIGFL